MIVKSSLPHLLNFVYHGPVKQVFLLYEPPPSLNENDLIYFSSRVEFIRNRRKREYKLGILARAEFVLSEEVKCFHRKNISKSAYAALVESEINRLLSKYPPSKFGWHTLGPPSYKDLRRFFFNRKFKGVRGLFVFKNIRPVYIKYEKVYETLKMDIHPAGKSYIYLNKVQVEAIERLLSKFK